MGDRGGLEKQLSRCKVVKTEDGMKLNCQSQRTNILPEDIVESLKYRQGVPEHLHETEDETLKNFHPQKTCPCLLSGKWGEKKWRSGELNFLAAAVVRGIKKIYQIGVLCNS